MQHDEGLLLQGLSSSCAELSTSTSRRDQELQSLSDLLQSIKQLQDQAEGVRSGVGTVGVLLRALPGCHAGCGHHCLDILSLGTPAALELADT